VLGIRGSCSGLLLSRLQKARTPRKTFCFNASLLDISCLRTYFYTPCVYKSACYYTGDLFSPIRSLRKRGRLIWLQLLSADESNYGRRLQHTSDATLPPCHWPIKGAVMPISPAIDNRGDDDDPTTVSASS
jgi:hypothetical protein